MNKSQSTITVLLLSTLCLALVSAQSHCLPRVSVTANSNDVTFYPGECLVGDTNGCHLVFERNCNLVLYNRDTPLWTSASAQDNTEDCRAVFQSDGNLVIYSYDSGSGFDGVNEESAQSARTALWSSDSWTQIQEASLEINNEHLQIVQTYNDNYKVTLDVSNPPSHEISRPSRLSDSSSVVVKTTDEDDFVFQEQQYIGDLDNTNLLFQDDCNLVLYDETGALWASGSVRNVAYSCELAVTRKGALVLRAKDDSSVEYWSWDGTNAVQGEIIWTEVKVEKGVMEIIYVAGNGFTVTYTTLNGDLELK